MHRKVVFALATVFLVVALVVPPTLVILQTNNTIYKYIIPGTSPVQAGPTNITITITPQERTNFNNAIIIAVIIEVVFILLFVVTVFYGINHTHPEH